MDIKLKYPIKIKADNGNLVEVSILTIGRLKARHLKLLPKGITEGKMNFNAHEIVPLIAGLAGISNESADEIDIEDLEPIISAVSSMVREVKSPETGKK